ncbi:hypothetical protein BDV96DRAFT_650496 [Lophiotrema nucula]|uniref:DUF7492 domain-containing protein n=1 Tax=Lophiotrema nucula TaxID=690887 RepID=A0A6A5YXQ6_9PLEO|nr:hypothetical protein BDV96DRAFT_650496 [Lophiotrema nucula]
MGVTPGYAYRYTENRQVSLPYQQVGKPEKAGTIYVFGTQNPKDDEKIADDDEKIAVSFSELRMATAPARMVPKDDQKIADVLQWTEDDNGGNKKGILVGIEAGYPRAFG